MSANSTPVRVDNDTYDTLRQLAEDEDRPMTRIVRSAVDVYEQSKLARAVRPTGGDGNALTPANPVTVEPVSTHCPHPKDRQRVLAWGTLCGLCGAKVR